MLEPRVTEGPVTRPPVFDHLEPCPSCGHLVRAGQRCDACDPAWPTGAEDPAWLPVLLAMLLVVAVVTAFVWL